MGGLGPAAVAAPVSDLGGVTLRQLVPVTFPGEGYAYLWTEHYRPKPALDFVRHDLALAAGIRPHS
jgi:hypothetical protein